MNVLKYRVSLDMFDTLSQITIKAKKGDSACQIHITLTEKGKIYHIGEGCYATFNAKKSDGNFIFDKCTIEDNSIVYEFSSSIDEDGNAQISACEGIVECEVTLYNAESHQLTSPRFTLFIDGTVYNGEEIISTPQANVLKELINEANSLIDEVETKLENGEFKGKDADTNLFANAIKNTKSGKAVAMNDVSPVEHNLDIKLTSEKGMVNNNFDISKITNTNNIKVNTEDDTIKLIGDGSSDYLTNETVGELCPQLKVGDVVTLKIGSVVSTFDNSAVYGQIYLKPYGQGLTLASTKNGGITFTITEEHLNDYFAFCSNNPEAIFSNIQLLTEGDLITDFSNVKVSRYGKNLFDITEAKICKTNNFSSGYYPKIENGVIYSGGQYAITEGSCLCVSTHGADIITFSFKAEHDESEPKKTDTVIRGCDEIGDDNMMLNNVKLSALNTTNSNLKVGYNYIAVNTQGKAYVGIAWYGSVKYSIKITELQIELGLNATEYEPYIQPQTVIANADGTVDAITSVSPNITIVTDTDGAIINCEYNRDINKAFAELQQAILNNS
jgi:hypothetical protein